MNLVTVECDGEVETHITGFNGNYATACGLDGEDPSVNQKIVGAGKVVTCRACADMWRHFRKIPPRKISAGRE